MLGEFDLIKRYLAPLADGMPGAFGLSDDAALLTPPPGRDLVLTADAMVAGLHFLEDDPPDLVARKLLRVNLSDLAAMGARPLGYLLTACWPRATEESWVEAFAAGLAADQREFQVGLLGGDTTGTSGPLSLSLTALGSVPQGACLRRASALPGDLIYVSGTLGDAALALAVLQRELEVPDEQHRAFLTERYRLPRPRLALGRALLEEGLATAALDVSDGLLADLGHMASASGLAATVRAADVPLSDAARDVVQGAPEHLETILTGGDDYELVFAAPPTRADSLADLANRLDLPLTAIGSLQAGGGVQVLDSQGNPISVRKAGWTHF